MHPFVHEQLPGRIVFGAGSFGRLRDEIDRHGCERVLLICSGSNKALGDKAAAMLGQCLTARIDEVRQHVPDTDVAAALEVVRAGVDGLVAIGGGSAVGLAKALAASVKAPIIAVPTTYSGSELTPFYGITSRGQKTVKRDLRVLPATVVYDPVLTLGVPADLTARSGMNALAHCVEALYDPDAGPIVGLLACEAIRALARGMPGSVAAPGDVEARSAALYGAYLSGAVLGAAQIALHHKLSHVLGGTYGLDHAGVHSAVLPHVARFNAPAAPEAMARVADALGATDAPAGIFDFAVSIGAPTSLAALGMDPDRLDEAAELTAQAVTWNPRPVSAADVRTVLTGAFAGSRP